MNLKKELEQILSIETTGEVENFSYDEWLEVFRKVPAKKIMASKAWLETNLPVEGFAAASRWIEIIGNPTKMDKLYQGRLRAKEKDSIMDLAVGDDDEAFYEALIKENVEKLDESRNSAQEVARITQNLNIFRKQLREIRSRKPKKGSVLEKVLKLSSKPPDPPKTSKKRAKTTKKTTKTKAKVKTEKEENEKKPRRRNSSSASRVSKSEVPDSPVPQRRWERSPIADEPSNPSQSA